MGDMAAEPPVDSVPDHPLEAVHELAFVLDQVKVDCCPAVMLVGFAESVTVGAGFGGGVTTPPPLPPQATCHAAYTTRHATRKAFWLFMNPPY
jgi:hypothetical protein